MKSHIVAHKMISVVVLIALLGAGYLGYKKITSTAGETRYITAKVEKGTIIASVSGTGQVAVTNQVDIKSKASGDVIATPINDGQGVAAGTLVVEINPKDANKAVRDAQVNLESAQIALEKIKKPADNLSVIQAQNTLSKANESKQTALDDLVKAHTDGFSEVTNTYLDLPNIMTGLNNMFYVTTSANNGQWNIDWYEGQVSGAEHDKVIILKNILNDSYLAALSAHNINFDIYKTTSRDSSDAIVESIIKSTYDTTKKIADAVKAASNLVNFVNDSMVKNSFNIPAIIATHLTNLNSYTSKTNAHLTSLASTVSTIENSKQAMADADRAIAENTESLAKLISGADALDVQSAELSVKQKENALLDANDKLADYFIHAPFDGTIAKVSVKKTDSISAGTVVATLITKKQLAEISLNEVDVAKIKIGEKATLTFDAIPGLSITGEVSEIDSVGTVLQGVVTYIVKISFDTQDDRVKSAMSVSSAIITDIKQDVLVVPNSAIKSQAGASYVENFNAPLTAPADGLIGSISKTAPDKIPVEVGLTNDSQSEIISGINEGDEIVTRTILPTTAKAAAAPSIFGSTGGNRGGVGGATRIPAR